MFSLLTSEGTTVLVENITINMNLLAAKVRSATGIMCR